jgi:hypothetical protein
MCACMPAGQALRLMCLPCCLLLQMFSGHIGTDELAAVALSNTVSKESPVSTLAQLAACVLALPWQSPLLPAAAAACLRR